MNSGAKPELFRVPGPNANYPDGAGVLAWDAVPVGSQQVVRVRLLSSSDTRGAIGVQLAVYSDGGEVSCGDRRGSRLWLWWDSGSSLAGFEGVAQLPHSLVGSDFLCRIEAPDGVLTISAVMWEPPSGGNPGAVWNGKSFSGLMREEQGASLVYRSNRFGRDEPFDKLVFSVELMGGA